MQIKSVISPVCMHAIKVCIFQAFYEECDTEWVFILIEQYVEKVEG